jgi:hypothetical protein
VKTVDVLSIFLGIAVLYIEVIISNYWLESQIAKLFDDLERGCAVAPELELDEGLHDAVMFGLVKKGLLVCSQNSKVF